MTDFSPRKKPQQERSRRTYNQIVDAAGELLVEIGYHDLTTNKIAEAAGVSIGSVYQYFPNKEAIVLALFDDFLERQHEILTSGLEDVQDADFDVAVRMMVENMVQAKRDQPQLSVVLFEQLPPIGQHDLVHELLGRARKLVHAALEQRPESFAPDDLELAAHLAVTAGHGILQDAVTTQPQLLEGDRLVDEVTDLMLRYLSAD